MKQLPIPVLKQYPCVDVSHAVCVCPVALVEEMGLKRAWVTSPLRVCWQLSPWWEVELEMEGLEPEPSIGWRFSSAQWPSLPYQVSGTGPKVLEQKP